MTNPTSQLPENYPEKLVEFYDYVLDELKALNQRTDESIAFCVAEVLRKNFSGVPLYFPKGYLYGISLRDQEIYEKFKGKNYDQLAAEYGLTSVQIRTIVKHVGKAEQAKRQQELPFE
jgi:Mor family transcriptional regulator